MTTAMQPVQQATIMTEAGVSERRPTSREGQISWLEVGQSSEWHWVLERLQNALPVGERAWQVATKGLSSSSKTAAGPKKTPAVTEGQDNLMYTANEDIVQTVTSDASSGNKQSHHLQIARYENNDFRDFSQLNDCMPLTLYRVGLS